MAVGKSVLVCTAVLVLCCLTGINGKTPPSLPLSPNATRPQITIDSGTLVGVEQDAYRAFVGIPYALPPIGPLRFQSPQPMAAWSGARDAITMGNVCMQPSQEREYQAEDCLYLNVWAPASSVCDGIEGGCPVWVHIHGGGWVGGAGSDGMYWGPFAANGTSSSPVISVSMNYRLGAFGFMATKRSDGTWYGNYGFEDQRLALQWVQKNIGAFGGNANAVTLTGQSAGGISVLTHFTSPKSFHLFHQIVVQSGPPTTRYNSIDEATSFTDKLANKVGCKHASLQCLQEKSAEEILAAQQQVHGSPLAESPLYSYDIAPWMIHIDGDNVYDAPVAQIRRGVFSPSVRSVVVGTTANETAGWVEGIPLGNTVYRVLLNAVFGSNNTAAIEREYPLPNRLPGKENAYAFSRLADDYAFSCANRALLRFLATTPPQPNRPNPPALAAYLFTHKPSSYPRNVGTVSHCSCEGCSCHGAELTFIKHSFAYANATFTPEEQTLSASMLGAWTSYVSSGLSSASFPAYDLEQDNILSIGLTASSIVNHYHGSYCDFWDSLNVYDVPT